MERKLTLTLTLIPVSDPDPDLKPKQTLPLNPY